MVIEGKCPCCGEAFSKFLLDPIHHVNVCLDRFTSSPRKGKDDEISAESSRRKGSVVVEDQDDTLTRCTHCRKDLKHLPHHLRKVHQEKCRKGDATGMGGAEVKAVPVKSTKRSRRVMKDQALCEFLSSLGLGRYVESLSREGLDLTALRLLSDDELTALKIPSAGRKRILESIPNLAIATRTKQIERMEGEENGCVDPKNDNLGDNVDVLPLLTQQLDESRVSLMYGRRSGPSLWSATKVSSEGSGLGVNDGIEMDDGEDTVLLSKSTDGCEMIEMLLNEAATAEVDGQDHGNTTPSPSHGDDNVVKIDSSQESRSTHFGELCATLERRFRDEMEQERRRYVNCLKMLEVEHRRKMDEIRTRYEGRVVVAGEEQPVEEQPVEEQPVEKQPVEEQPVEKQPVEEQPVEEQPVEELVREGKEEDDDTEVLIATTQETEGKQDTQSSQEADGVDRVDVEMGQEGEGGEDEEERGSTVDLTQNSVLSVEQSVEDDDDEHVDDTEILSLTQDKKWSGYSDEDLCRVLRDSKLYEAILTRDHVSFHRIHQAFHDANVKLPRTVLCRFLEAQGVGYSSGAKDAEATNKHKQLIEARK